MRNILILLGLLFVFIPESNAQTPADPKATTRTTNLFENLKIISKQGFMLGHQDDQAYGVGWKAQSGRSDVLETAGSISRTYQCF